MTVQNSTSTARKILVWLSCVAVVLFILHITTQLIIGTGMVEGGLKNYLLSKFDLNEEQVIGSWFSSTLLVAAAILLFIIGMVEHMRNNKKLGIIWVSLGIIFTYLSIDESISLHEALVVPMRDILGVGPGVFYYAWVIPVIFLLILFIVVYARFWWNLSKKCAGC